MDERAPFRLTVLGTPDLRAPDGRRVGSVLSQPKRLALLTYLALARSPVARAEVANTFWPDSDETRARNALSQALFHLRRALGEHVVENVEGDRLWVSPERLRCDARELLLGDAFPDPAFPADGSPELLEGWRADEPPLQAWLEQQRANIRGSIGRPPEPPRPEPPARPSSPRARRSRWAALAAALVLASVAVAAGRLAGGPATQDLVVLLPRVTSSPGGIELDPQVVLDEVLAHLPRHEHVRIIPAPSASSVQTFRTQLATIGATDEDAPDWILEVSARVSTDEVGVVGLLYRTPALDVPGRESFGVAYGHADGALLDVPRGIARGVAVMVARVLDER